MVLNELVFGDAKRSRMTAGYILRQLSLNGNSLPCVIGLVAIMFWHGSIRLWYRCPFPRSAPDVVLC